jgi:S-DNA-T family DNA segregation ATPase FtsK/SpoIIIE
MQLPDTLILILAFFGIAGIIFALVHKKKTLPPAPAEPFQKMETQNVPEITTLPDITAPTEHISVTLAYGGSVLEEEENEIPLTIDVTRPIPIINNEQTDAEKARALVAIFGQYDPKLDLSSYQYPNLDLLEYHGSDSSPVSANALDEQKQQIVTTLNSYGVQIDHIKATIGPTVTLFEITPAPGVRIATIKKLEHDIAFSLAVAGTKVLGHLPGKGTIGIEVPHKDPGIVSMRSVISSDPFMNNTMELPVALGKTMDNEVYVTDLAKTPHMLIAGATGQGKSVSINAILTSLLYKKHPSELKFVLIDINRLELTLYRKIERHFLAALPDGSDAVITEQSKVADTLNALCLEMDERFVLLSDAQVRNMNDYNEKFVNRNISDPEKHRYLPYIVLVIDEFSDLVSPADKSTESLITRITQRGRTIGIHVIISTQRPAINVITGTIKANFATRLAFRLSSAVDSRTIFDTNGAEQLKGNGDLLYSNGSELIHLQGAYMSTAEVERVCDFIGDQRGYPSAMFLPEYNAGAYQINDFDPAHIDPMFSDAARLIVLHQQGSTSLIQRKMKLGYNRAGHIIDQLEAAGIVGPFEGSRAREVLFPDEYSLERYLKTLNK